MILLLVISIIKKKPQYCLIPLISFAIGIGLYFFATLKFNSSTKFTPSLIQARIYDISSEHNGIILVECDSCEFNGDKVNDNILVYIYDSSSLFEHIEVGSVIRIIPNKFYKTDLFYNSTPNSYMYTNNLKYTVSAYIDDITYINTDKTLAEKVKDRIHNNLKDGLTNENAEIAYSALFGDKDMLSVEQYNVYKLSGVAHLLAVSGLHVGILVGILNWICKKFNIRNWFKFATVAVILAIYAYLCGFSVSILRASIMSLILLLANNLGKEYDSFNSIAIAGIIIFIINPFCVFDVGFLLSFACVIGIAMLYKPIARVLVRMKVHPKIAKPLSISIATTTSIIFIMAYFFHTLNVISIIANVILIPIFSIAFMVTFLTAIISIAVPYICYILYPINYIFTGINIIATIFGGLFISNFNTIGFNFIAIVLYFLLLLLLGRFCTAKYQYKLISVLPIVALLFCCLL